MNLCVNCVFLYSEQSVDKVHYLHLCERLFYSPVTGEYTKLNRHAMQERQSPDPSACGPSAQYFREKV